MVKDIPRALRLVRTGAEPLPQLPHPKPRAFSSLFFSYSVYSRWLSSDYSVRVKQIHNNMGPHALIPTPEDQIVFRI